MILNRIEQSSKYQSGLHITKVSIIAWNFLCIPFKTYPSHLRYTFSNYFIINLWNHDEFYYRQHFFSISAVKLWYLAVEDNLDLGRCVLGFSVKCIPFCGRWPKEPEAGCFHLGFPSCLLPWRLGGGSLAAWRLYAELLSLHCHSIFWWGMAVCSSQGRLRSETGHSMSSLFDCWRWFSQDGNSVKDPWVVGPGLTLLKIRWSDPSVPMGGGVLFLFL